MKTRVYGHRPGQVYGEPDVWMYMPRDVLQCSSEQVNYLTATSGRDFYIILMNQAARPIETSVRLNSDVIPVDVSREYPVELLGGKRAAGRMVNGELAASLAAKGIVTIIVNGLAVARPLHPTPFLRSEGSYLFRDSGDPALGRVAGMLIAFTPELSEAYIYTDATEEHARAARLRVNAGNGWQVLDDDRYPYEFNVPFTGQPGADATAAGGARSGAIKFQLETRDRAGAWHSSEVLELRYE